MDLEAWAIIEFWNKNMNNNGGAETEASNADNVNPAYSYSLSCLRIDPFGVNIRVDSDRASD